MQLLIALDNQVVVFFEYHRVLFWVLYSLSCFLGIPLSPIEYSLLPYSIFRFHARSLTFSFLNYVYFMVCLESLFSANKAACKNYLCLSDGDPHHLI